MVIVVDMREITLPFVHLTYFGGIVVDKFETDDTIYWIIHFSTLNPIDLQNLEQLRDILSLFFDIASSVKSRFIPEKIKQRKAIISGRIPMVLIPYLTYMAFYAGLADKRHFVYIFDPKLKKAINEDLNAINIPDEVLVKLLQEYDELVKKRHSQ